MLSRARVLWPWLVLLVTLSVPLESAAASPPSFATRVEEVEGRPLQHRVLELPPGHGYERGAWLGYFLPVPGILAARGQLERRTV